MSSQVWWSTWVGYSISSSGLKVFKLTFYRRYQAFISQTCFKSFIPFNGEKKKLFGFGFARIRCQADIFLPNLPPVRFFLPRYVWTGNRSTKLRYILTNTHPRTPCILQGEFISLVYSRAFILGTYSTQT